MTTLLEARYRTVLRLLPPYYRALREEEMVEAYLHGVDEDVQDVSRPEWGEVASVAALAVRTRLGGAGAPARYAALGAVVRHFVLFSLLLRTVSALTDRALCLAWFRVAGPEDRRLLLGGFTGQGAWEDFRTTAAWVLPLAWAAALGALLRDRRRTALVCAAVATLPDLLVFADAVVSRYPVTPHTYDYVTAGFSLLTLAALSCGFHSDAPAVRLPLVPPGQAVLALCVVAGAATLVWREGADQVGYESAAFTALALGWLTVRLPRPALTVDPAPALALAAVGAAELARRVALLTLESGGNLPGTTLLGLTAQAAVIALLVLALAGLGARGLRASTVPGRRRARPGGA